MPTDYLGLSTDVLQAFEEAYPVSEDTGIRAEIEALEALFGCPMPEEVGRFLQVERSELFDPSPVELATLDHPFEALILRAQEMDDTANLLFPLTGSIYLRNLGGIEMLGHVTGISGRPVMPFAGWRNEKWAFDLPSLHSLVTALKTFLFGQDSYEDDGDYQRVMGPKAEALLAPVWGRVQPTQWTQNMFDAIEDCEALSRLDAGLTEQEDLRGKLSQWWRHERALLLGFGLIGKFRAPEPEAFAKIPWKVLDQEHFVQNLAAQMVLLWRGWFLNEEDLLERTMDATESSRSMLVQDARRLIGELLDGRQSIGTVDMQEARANYGAWVKDPGAYRTFQRARRRTELEREMEPTPFGIELTRADWPLQEAAKSAGDSDSANHAWNAETRTLTVGSETLTLPAPDESLRLYLARANSCTALSPSADRFSCVASWNRLPSEGGGNVPVIAEFDRGTGSWRVLAQTQRLHWFAYLDEDRWLVYDKDELCLLRDLGDEINTTPALFAGQPHRFHIPELQVLIAYGSAAIAEGRDPHRPKTPWIRVYAYWRERLECIAAFPLDGVELAARQTENDWSVGLISHDREVAWELRGLAQGAQAWRLASQEAQAKQRAAREAFGPVTVERAVEALNTFLGTQFGPEIQEGLDAAFAHTLEAMRNDEAAVAAARAADTFLAFAPTFRGPFHSAMTTLRRDKEFLTFAYSCAGSRPEYADVVVRACVKQAWDALR